jgi:hypothetical protein
MKAQAFGARVMGRNAHLEITIDTQGGNKVDIYDCLGKT